MAHTGAHTVSFCLSSIVICLHVYSLKRSQAADKEQTRWKILKTVELRAHFSPTFSLSLSLHFNNSVLLLAEATTTCELGATT